MRRRRSFHLARTVITSPTFCRKQHVETLSSDRRRHVFSLGNNSNPSGPASSMLLKSTLKHDLYTKHSSADEISIRSESCRPCFPLETCDGHTIRIKVLLTYLDMLPPVLALKLDQSSAAFTQVACLVHNSADLPVLWTAYHCLHLHALDHD